MKKLILLILAFVCLTSCSKDLYEYYDYDNLIYAYTTGGVKNKELKKFSKKYMRLTTTKKGKRKIPAPGVCVEYGYLLYKQDRKDEARDSFIREMQLYPESKTYVDGIMKSLGL